MEPIYMMFKSYTVNEPELIGLWYNLFSTVVV